MYQYSIVLEDNLIADKEKLDRMLNYYQTLRKLLYPQFYEDDEIFIDLFQFWCIRKISEKSEVTNFFSQTR